MRQEIIDKLELLEEYIAILRDLQQYSFEEIENSTSTFFLCPNLLYFFYN